MDLRDVLREMWDWTDGLALCAETDPDAFHVEQGDSNRPAKEVCRRCDIRGECLVRALMGGESYGVWGGFSPREREAVVPVSGGPSGAKKRLWPTTRAAAEVLAERMLADERAARSRPVPRRRRGPVRRVSGKVAA